MNSALYLIAIPLLGAFAVLLLKKFHQLVALGITLFMTVSSAIILFSGQLPANVIIGGWQPPFGINFVLTTLSAGFVLLVNLAALLALVAIQEAKKYQFYAIYLVLLAATNGLILTGDLFNFFIFVELTTFALAGLIAYSGNRLSTGTALKYLILSSTAGAFLLIGIGVIYKTLGTLNMAEAAAHLGNLNSSVLSLVMVLILAGIFVELEVFPFNIWVPNAYLSSKTSVTLMLHGMLGTAASYITARILVTLFAAGGNGVLVNGSIRNVVIVIAIATMLISQIAAYSEKKLKKVLAFSSMAQMGLILFAFMVGSKEAVTGAFFIVIANYLSKIILLALSGEYSRAAGSDNWQDMKGLGRKYPLAALAFTTAALTVMGMPLFAGFWGKLGILQGAVRGDGLLLTGAVTILIAAVVEGIYLLKIAHTLFLPGEDGHNYLAEPRKLIVGTAVILAGAAIVIGLYPGLLESIFNLASAEIMDPLSNYIKVVFPGGV